MKQLKRITTAANKELAFMELKKGFNKAIARIININHDNGYVIYSISKLAKVTGEYGTKLSTTKIPTIYVTKTYSLKTNKLNIIYILQLYLGQNLLNKVILVDIKTKDNCIWIENTLILELNLQFHDYVSGNMSRRLAMRGKVNNKEGKNQHNLRKESGLCLDNLRKESGLCLDNLRKESGLFKEGRYSSTTEISNILVIPLNTRIIENLNTRIIENLNTTLSKLTTFALMEATLPPVRVNPLNNYMLNIKLKLSSIHLTKSLNELKLNYIINSLTSHMNVSTDTLPSDSDPSHLYTLYIPLSISYELFIQVYGTLILHDKLSMIEFLQEFTLLLISQKMKKLKSKINNNKTYDTFKIV